VCRLFLYILLFFSLSASAGADDKTDSFGDFVLQEHVEGSTTYEGGVVDFKAGKAVYQRQDNTLQLRDDVAFSTSEGLSLETDSVSWDRTRDLVSSEEPVVIRRKDPSATVTGTGLLAHPGLKTASLREDVTVTTNTEDGRKVVITCDGPLELRHEEGSAVFSDNVRVTQADPELYADRAQVDFDPGTQALKTVVAEGNVRIVRGGDTTTAERSRYTAADKRIVLEGRPKLIFFQQEGEDIFQGMGTGGAD